MVGDSAQARLQELPEAAALLATPAAAKSGGGALSNLKDWAPAPLLQVIALFRHHVHHDLYPSTYRDDILVTVLWLLLRPSCAIDQLQL